MSPAPGLLEAYAAGFDAHFRTLARRRGFREYVARLLLPRDRTKTLTALKGATEQTHAWLTTSDTERPDDSPGEVPPLTCLPKPDTTPDQSSIRLPA